MALSKDYCLILKNGRVLASDISGENPAVEVDLVDILLFSALEDIDGISSKVLQAFVPEWSDKELVKSKRIVLDKTPAFSQNSNQQTISIRTHLSDFEVKKHVDINLEPSMNFSLVMFSQSWVYWSSIHQLWIEASLEEVLVLIKFYKRVKYNEPYDKTLFESLSIQGTLMRWFTVGALIPLKELCGSKESSTELEKTEIQVDWRSMVSDNRIPVYFVPHMKNHYPLALGVLSQAIKNHKGGEFLNKYQLIPIEYMQPGDFLNGPYKKFGIGVWLFSNYMWSIDVNLQISEAIKKHNNKNITIHGGPSTPEYPKASEEFMGKYGSVDISVHGEGEVAITEILSNLEKTGSELCITNDMKEVSGITYKSLEKKLIRTGSRKRTSTPDAIPSPYLEGEFSSYGSTVEAAIIESHRGCPFGCTFCDWGSATNQKVRKFDLTRVKSEIDWIAENKVRVLWIADANFGLYDRDIELAKHIVESRDKTGFPREVVVNYTKNSTWRLVEIIKIFTAGGIISQGIISIQTTDEKTLEVINRKNIKTEKYDELTKVFYDLKLPLSTDLMMGLPGTTIEAFNKDLQRYIDMDVSVKAYPTQLLPNSPMADPEYIDKYKIKTDKNDFLISTYSYTEEDLNWMKSVYHTYTVADGYGLLRYVMRYLQWEYDISAMAFLTDLMHLIIKSPSQFKTITWALRYFISNKYMPGGWHNFYLEIGDFVNQNYGIELDSGWEVVMKVSELSMPDDAMIYPMTFSLKHDFSAYFLQKKKTDKISKTPLTNYPAAKFVVSDPNNMVKIDMDYLQYDSHQYFWELQSDVARPKSTSEFVS